MKISIYLLSLWIIATSTSALPRGYGPMHHEELLMKAADLLARAEEDGGRLISQMLLDQDFSHNRKVFDPLVETQWKRFVEQLIADLKALGAELGGEADGGTRARLGRSSHGNVILPNGIFIPGLDFNDILDILGGYGKGLYSLLIPVLSRRGRDVGDDSVRQLYNQLQHQILQVRLAARR